MKRIYSKELKIGKEVLVKGWIQQIRDLGGLKFFILRDREGIVQITLKKGKVSDKLFNLIPKLGKEYCIAVKGLVIKSKQAPNGKEITPHDIEIISKAATPLPLDFYGKIESGKDKRFDYRFLDLRNQKVQAIFRIRDKVCSKLREYFESNGFVEVHTPTIQAAGAEGGATLFPIIYYQREAFLRQSPQLYKQILMASGLDKVYEIAPAFRAEKFHTARHVSEFLSVDTELAWIDSEEDVLKVAERLIIHTLKGVKEECKAELKILGRKINMPSLPFKRIKYDEALKLIRKKVKIEWGEDIADVEEKILGEILAKKGIEWYFITKFPSKIKPFYIMMDGKYSRGMDLDYSGMEIASGGQREHRYNLLVKVMKEKGLDPHKFEFYLDAFRYGMPAHGGFAVGGDRLVQKIVGMDDIKETILFPRTPEKLIP